MSPVTRCKKGHSSPFLHVPVVSSYLEIFKKSLGKSNSSLIAVDIRRIVEGLVGALDRLSSTLILKVPIETRKGSVLSALMLQKLRTLVNS